MLRPEVIKRDPTTFVIREKFFDASILTIPLAAALLPDLSSAVLVGAIVLLLVLALFFFTIKQTTIIHGASIKVHYSILLASVVVSSHSTRIEKDSFSITVGSISSGGGTESGPSELFTILLRNGTTVVARIGKFNTVEPCRAMASSLTDPPAIVIG